jgi:CheY-like chemotaxis protein
MSARILIIEDSEDFLEVLTYSLKNAGYTLLIAKNGQEGLEMARKEQPNLILTDLMLPKMNGYEICTMLKQDVRYQKIPIFVLSATKVQEKDEKLAKECGANEYILKTIEPKQLMEKIREALAASGQAQQSPS